MNNTGKERTGELNLTLVKMLAGADDHNVAVVIMDIVMESFTEDNFSCYDCVLHLVYRLRQLVKGGIIDNERSKRIDAELKKLFDKAIADKIKGGQNYRGRY
jgi:hypothetical protein